MTREEGRNLSLDRVIRRATELQMASGRGEDDALSDEEIVRIGREVGLETVWLKRALQELRAEERLPEVPGDDGWLARMVGPGHVGARRVVNGDPGRVEERLSEWMVERESLYPIRRRAGISIWQPSEGIAAQFKRSFSWQGHRYELARVPEVEMGVQGLEEGRSLVALSVGLRAGRRSRGLGWMGGLPVALSAGGAIPIAALGLLPPAWIALPVAAGLALGLPAGVMAARSQHGEEVQRVSRAMEGILDRLERGELDPHSR